MFFIRHSSLVIRNLLRDFDRIKDAAYHGLGRYLFGFCLIGEDDSVAKHIHAHCFYVLGSDISTAFNKGMSP